MRQIYKPLALSLVLFISVSAYFAQSAQNAPVEIEGWDISGLDAKIAELATKANAISASLQDKGAAANAYLERANFFYEAGRPSLYKLAVGDFRRVLRLQPENQEAQEKLEMIVSIYKAMDRPVPEQGNEKDAYNDPSVRYKLKPQLIKFSPEEKTVTLSERMQSGIAYVYEFNGNTGQQMFVKMKVDNAAAAFDVYKGQIDNASQIISEVTEWRGVIPEDGKYLIKVKPKENAASYKLIVTAK
jgi:tetratricopeptide (TPR) repeat protein